MLDKRLEYRLGQMVSGIDGDNLGCLPAPEPQDRD